MPIFNLNTGSFQYDECDAALIESHTWHLNKSGHATYVRSNETREYLHRLIMGAPHGLDVDHKDGDGLNCRRANLRVATRSQNNMNRRSQRDGRKGIHLEKFTGMWRAEIIVGGKRYRSKRLPTEKDAIIERESMERSFHQDFTGIGTAMLA
jgi:hypothetical protein